MDRIENVFGSGFIAKVIAKEGTKAIIECDYHRTNFNIGDPAKVDPYKHINKKKKEHVK